MASLDAETVALRTSAIDFEDDVAVPFRSTWVHPCDEEGDEECDPVSSPDTIECPASPSMHDCPITWPEHTCGEHAPSTSTLADKPAKGRKTAAKGSSCKTQRTCLYEHCPSPMQSSKWRVVTATTVAGNRDWQSLFGMTLCDSCYSTYRKHGTFIRSVRTPEGWARFDHSAQAHILNKPSKKRVTPAPRPIKRARPSMTSQHPMAGSVKRCRLVIDEGVSEDPQAGRPKRERKPSAKMRDTLAPEDDDDDSIPETPTTTLAHSKDHAAWSFSSADNQHAYFGIADEEAKVQSEISLDVEQGEAFYSYPTCDDLYTNAPLDADLYLH